MTTPYERPPVPPVGSYPPPYYNNVPPGVAPPPPMPPPLHTFPPYVPPKKSNAGKIIAGLSLVAVAVVAVIASSHNSTDSASASPSVTADTPYTPPNSDTSDYGAPSLDDQFVAQLQNHDSFFADIPGPTMIDTAHSMCRMLSGGGTVRQAVGMALNVGFTANDAGWFIGTAVSAYCPQYVYEIQQGN